MGFNILFVKTAKCATETLKKHLLKYAKDNSLKVNDGPFNSFYKNGDWNINTNHIWMNEKSLNHFYNSIDKDKPTIKISSVRNPLDRLYSHYCFGNPSHNAGMDFNEWYVKTIKGEIKDYWPASRWGDKTTNYMWDYMGVSSLESLKEQYDFITVKERFEDSLIKLGNILDYEFEDKTKEINKNPKSKKDYKFTSEVIELFEENNQKDVDLYNYILKNYY